jgi:site-specific DNA-adenine methylase
MLPMEVNDRNKKTMNLSQLTFFWSLRRVLIDRQDFDQVSSNASGEPTFVYSDGVQYLFVS